MHVYCLFSITSYCQKFSAYQRRNGGLKILIILPELNKMSKEQKGNKEGKKKTLLTLKEKIQRRGPRRKH